MTDYTIISLGELGAPSRLDAEFYQREYVSAAQIVVDSPKLSSLVTSIDHPAEVRRDYADLGCRLVLAQHVRPNRLHLGEPVYLDETLAGAISRNLINENDVLVTRSGANYGDAAAFFGADEPLYACADLLIVRNPSLPAGYLSSYLSCELGRRLVKRGGYGAGQPHIAPPYLLDLPVPRLGPIEKAADDLVRAAYAALDQARADFDAAGRILAEHLGLKDTTDVELETWTTSAAEVVAASRLDAEFFSPRYRQARPHLGNATTIADVATVSQARFIHGDYEVITYSEIGDILEGGRLAGTPLLAEDAPARATYVLHAGDVVVSTVRPLRRLVAQVSPENDGWIASSGLAVLCPHDVEPEVLLTYLRLPAVAGLLHLQTGATMYPAVSAANILDLPFPEIDDVAADQVVSLVRRSRASFDLAGNHLIQAESLVSDALGYSADA